MTLPTIYYLILVFGIIAALLSICFFAITFIKKIQTNTIYVFLLNLSVITALHSISYSLNWTYKYNNNDEAASYFGDNIALCYIQSILSIFSSSSSEFWISIITFRFYYEMKELMKKLDSGEYDKEYLLENGDKLLPKISIFSLVICYCIAYAIPALLVTIIASTNAIGMSVPHCWIISDKARVWRVIIIVNKGLNIIFSVIISCLIISKQKGNDNSNKCCSLKGKNIKILIIPLIQLIGALPSLIYLIIAGINKELSILKIFGDIYSFLWVLQGVLYPLFFASICGVYNFLCSSKIQIEADDALSLKDF